jgi:hypothetical protein
VGMFGQMVEALRRAGYALSTYIASGSDFLTVDPPRPFQGIATNLPYALATLTFVEGIRWFEDYPASPSFNHAWFLWSRAHSGPPTIAYAPELQRGVPNTRCA